MGVISLIIVFSYRSDLNFNMTYFFPLHLNEEVGWIFIDLDSSHLIHNEHGTWRKFYRELINGQFCFHTTRLRGAGGKDTNWKDVCCGEESPHYHFPQVTIDKITADFTAMGVDDALQKYYFKLITDHRMPFTQAEDNTFYDFTYASILAGKMDPRPPDKIFPHLSRKKLSKLLRKKGREKINDYLWSLSGHEVCIVLDAGMAGDDNTIICLICEPSASAKPFPYQSYTRGTKRSNYAKPCARIVFELRRYNITVTSFITDGLKRQVEACDPLNEESYVQYLTLIFEKEKTKNNPFAPPKPPSWLTKYAGGNNLRIYADSHDGFFCPFFLSFHVFL